MSRNWKEYKESAIKDYLDGVTVSQLADKYDSNIPNIIAGLQRVGVYRYATDHWTDEDVSFLKDNYAFADWDVILRRLNRFNKQGIIKKASTLGLKRKCFYWSEEDVEILKSAYKNKVPDLDLQELFGYRFSLESIRTKASKLKLSRRTPWTVDDEKIMFALYEITPTEDLEELFPGHTLIQIQQKARKLGLHSSVYLKRKWSDMDDQFIKDNWTSMSDYDLAEHLGRGYSALKMRRQFLGLKREVQPGSYEYLRESLKHYLRDWKRDSMRACSYKCVVTGGRFNDIHHLYASSLILQQVLDELGFEKNNYTSYSAEQLSQIAERYIELHYEHPLGVCLSRDVHMQFHQQYGFGNNTPEQFLDFLKINYPTIQIPVTIKTT